MQSAQATPSPAASTLRYARCIENSKRIRWDIDRDVIRQREFGADDKFLPDSLTLLEERLAFLSPGERRFLNRIQGRTYGQDSRGPRFFAQSYMKLDGRWQCFIHAIMDYDGLL